MGPERKKASSILLILLLIGMLVLAFEAGLVWAGGTIYIQPDGSIDPPTAPISRDGDVYTFTDNISDTFIIGRDNIVVNGAGYTLQGPGNGTVLFDRSNVTIRNMNIEAHEFGFYIWNCSNISLEGNTIRDNYCGVMLWGSQDNRFYHNNFIDNTDQVYIAQSFANAWDDGYPSGGNCWSDYGGTDANGDGIGDTAYSIDSNNQDSYPLMEPWIPFDTWTVDDDGPADFHIIQEAINAATDRDTIFVHSGIYYENVIVNKSVSIIGEEATEVSPSPIVDGSELGHVLNVTRDNVRITGFRIQNSGYLTAGIYLDNVNQCDIVENAIVDNVHGIWLWNSSENRISGNNVVNNDHGIYLEFSSNNNSIHGNHLTTNFNGSLTLYASVNNRIAWNDMTNSSTCVTLSSSFDNVLSGNHLTNNTFGVSLVSSEDNTFYHNNFIANGEQVYSYESVNVWDDGYPSGGNHWDDYGGTDANGDGIGDTPYPTGMSDQDNYPLMEPWTPSRIHVHPLISYAAVGEIFSIDISAAGITNLYGFTFALGYDTALLDVIDVVVGPFLNEPTLVVRREINDEGGLICFDVMSQSPAEEVDGTGTLAIIFFYVRDLGECVLDLYDVVLRESDGFPITHFIGDGFYEGGMTQVVSTESNLDSYHPSLAVDLDGNVHVAWHDLTDSESETDWDIFYKRKGGEQGWAPTEVVSTGCYGTSAYPSLAVDSGGNVHIAWHDNTTDLGGSGIDFDIVYRRYVVGVGWGDIEVVSAESTGDSLLPSLAVDSSGNVHVAWHDETDLGSGTDWDIFYKNRTSDWSTTEVVSTQNPSNRDSLRPSLAVDSIGNIHIAWDDVTNYAGSGSDSDVFYRRYDVGVGWTDIEVVSTESTLGSYDASLAVDSSGNVHVAWHDDTDLACGPDRDIFYKRYEVGVDWTAVEIVSNESNADSWYPSLAVDSSGNVHVAWDDRPSGTDWSVFYRRYEAVRANWTNTQVVSTESTENSWVASLAVDSSRNVHIAWHDVTDYAGCGSDTDIFYKYLCLHSTQYPWPMFRHNIQHTGYTESPAPNTNKTMWSHTTGGYVESSPAVAYGMVFVGSNDGDVYALDQYTGALVWNYTTAAGIPVYSSPAVAYGNVYVASFDHKVYCLNAATGAHIWNRTTGGVMRSSPTVADGRVYVGSDDAKVYCFNAFTGESLWNQTTGGWIYTSSPAVAYGKIYVGSMDNKIYCLDASTGAHVWDFTTGDDVQSSPAVADGRVYVGSWDGKVYCLDAVDGTHNWNRTIGSAVHSSPAVAYGKVFVGSSRVYCLNAADGTHIWNHTAGGFVWSSPAVADGRVYVGSQDGKVYCLNAATGASVWNYTTNSVVYSSPAIADDMLFVGSDDNTVYAFGGVIRVPEDYLTIQAAIDAADPGDTISIAPGTYHESLVIDKPLTLLGRKGSSTTFAGGGSGIAVNITDTSYVTITNIDITYWTQGIFIDNSSDCQIYNNVMYLMSDSGIVVDGENAANNQIYNNIFQDNNFAIDVSASSTGNIIYGNTITQNSIGINVVASGGNTIYCNSFINNGQQVNIASQPNAWDYSGLGNYWSDYTGIDADGDGIGDTPYPIDSNNEDNYPLMSPYEYWGNPMLGDVNMDMVVNQEDLFRLATAYGSIPQMPNWNANCDLNRNYKIEVLDLFNLCKNYGKIR